MKSLNNLILILSSRNFYNPGLGLARASLATCTLLTLLANNPANLFNLRIGINEARTNIIPFLDSDWNLFKIWHESMPYLGSVIAISILLLVIAGWRPRITGILHFWVAYSFLSASAVIDGGDQICSNLTLMLIPITLLDKRKNHWYRNNPSYSPYANILSNLVYFVIALQISFIYLNAATSKFSVSEWSNGTAVYYWLIDPYFGLNSWQSWLLKPFIVNPIFIFIITWSVLAVELLLFAGIFIHKKYYKVLFFSGIILHLSFLLFLGLFSFFFAVTGGLVLYLLVPYISYKNYQYAGR